MSDKIKPHHLERKAVLYIRQSSAHQVLHNLESQKLQYAMQKHLHQLRAISERYQTNMSSTFSNPANSQSETRKQSRHKREPKGPQTDEIRGNRRNEARDRVAIQELIRLLHRVKKHPDETSIRPVLDAIDQADAEDTLRELCEFDRNAAAQFFLLAFYAGLMRHDAAFLDAELTNLRKCADYLPTITDGPPIKTTIDRFARALLTLRETRGEIASEIPDDSATSAVGKETQGSIPR